MTRFEMLCNFYHSVIFNGLASSTKRVSHNTTVSIKNGVLVVTLHNTEIIGVDLKNKKLCINTGGWNTVTTRKVMNEALNAFCINYWVNCKNGVFQVNGSPANRYNEYQL